MREIEMLIIGGGSAGMSAAISAKEAGVEDILILERGEELGGILQQCIHNGFGLQTFHEELSGPMYAQRFIDKVRDYHIPYCLNTDVLKIHEDCSVQYSNAEEGCVWIKAKTILLACGCYERSRGAISLPGRRMPGVYTAGSAQRFLNLENIRVGQRVLILGSGDIGLIMARRMTLEGATVVGVAEVMPYSNGLNRNIVQCLNDFDIPLYLSHTVIDIQGKQHVEQVTIAQVDDHRKVIEGSEKVFAVDTLLLSVGLLPEMELGDGLAMERDPVTKGAKVNEYFETSIPHIYACGNALHVHDIVDFVTLEAKEAARCAVEDHLRQHKISSKTIASVAGEGISYVLPQRLSQTPDKNITFCFRVRKPMRHVQLLLRDGERILKRVNKRYLLPSEMERITLKQEELGTLQKELRVEVEVL